LDDASSLGRTERQAEVLDAALTLLMEKGDRFTMEGVARRASCSKETLYKWFGDRDGLLTAIVRWQASQVRAGAYDAAALEAADLRASLEDFAAAWLRVVTGPSSIALNRAAAAHAAAGKPEVGQIVLAEGRFAIGARVKPLLDAGREAGLLSFEDAEGAFRTLFGLVARDVQIRLLLGDALVLGEAEILRDAAHATDQFLALYGATKPPAAAGQSSL
jgi:AcrR family transcriptional regulator